MARSRTLIGVSLVAALVPALLAGCASSNVDTSALADTKGPAQLLRNSVSSRVPKADVMKLGEADDKSVGCGQNGIMRSWLSSQLIFVQPENAYKIKSILTDVVSSLKLQGWTPSLADASSNIHQATLKSTKTSATILVTATEASDEKGNGATMEVDVTGPCVKTGGPDSDEVKHLENRG
ncbi:hypothetical protein BH11ACT2_BH11ACT2_11020 [soil metagenome]